MDTKLSASQRIISYLNVLLRLVIIVLLIILLHSIYKGLQQDGYIIQAIQSPKSLTDSGYNGVVIANKMQDKIKIIKNAANSARQDSLVISANSTADLQMDVMGIGVSSTSLIYHLRDLLNIETKTIRGDLTDLDNELSLTVRVHDFPVKVLSEAYTENDRTLAFDKLITRSAEHVLSCTDPYYQVINLYESERYEKAQDLIREMINNRPGEAKWAYLAWGNMMRRQRKDERAKEYLKKALEIDNNFFLANKNLGWHYVNDDNYEVAISHFEKALNEQPNDFESINAIARCYTSLNDTQRSESYYKLNVERNPEIVWSYMAYADFFTSVKKDTQEAVDVFNQARYHVAQNDDYYHTQAGFYFFQNKLDSALLFLNKTLDFNPNNVGALEQLIEYMTSPEVGKHSEAIVFIKRYVEIQKQNDSNENMRINGYNRLAMAEWQSNEFDSALVHVQQAIDINPTHPIPYTTLAEIHYALNDHKSFYRIFQKAFDLGLEFEEKWFRGEPYSSLRSDPNFMAMIDKYKVEKLKQ